MRRFQSEYGQLSGQNIENTLPDRIRKEIANILWLFLTSDMKINMQGVYDTFHRHDPQSTGKIDMSHLVSGISTLGAQLDGAVRFNLFV